ncbi:hypothetical protein EMCRGX_G013624 [Ephydatia muelleri]
MMETLYVFIIALLSRQTSSSSSSLLDTSSRIDVTSEHEAFTPPYSSPTPLAPVGPSSDSQEQTIASFQWEASLPLFYSSSEPNGQLTSPYQYPTPPPQPSTLYRDSLESPMLTSVPIVTYSSFDTLQLLLYSSLLLNSEEPSASLFLTPSPQPSIVPQQTQDSRPFGMSTLETANADSSAPTTTHTAVSPSFQPSPADVSPVGPVTPWLTSTPSVSPSPADRSLVGPATLSSSWTPDAMPPRSSLCPTPPPAPPRVPEGTLVTSARCRTSCLNSAWSFNERNTFIQKNYIGSPSLLIVPDSYLCAASTNTFNRVWECTNACAKFGTQSNCASRCFSNCTAACSSDACSNYYPPSTPCRARTCNMNFCSEGCTAFRSMNSGLSTSPRPLGPPQLVSVSNQSSLYQVNISSVLPRSVATIYTNLIIRVQRADNSSSLPAYYWLVSTEDLLDLSPFSCQNISISFAVVSFSYMSSLAYSTSLNVQLPPVLGLPVLSGSTLSPSLALSGTSAVDQSITETTSGSVKTSAPLITASGMTSLVQPTPTSAVVPSPTPRPHLNITVDFLQERDAMRKASCHTWCISNYVMKPAQDTFIQRSYPGSPTWLIMPDTYLCNLATMYGSVWECRDACVNYRHSTNCSSNCFSNCTASCPRFNSCFSYYTSQPQQCRMRTCSPFVCSIGCNWTINPFSDKLPGQYRPLGAPQLVETDISYVFILNITSAVPRPSPVLPALLSNLVVKVQSVGREAPPTYYWLISTENPLNLSDFAGLTVNVSFAVVSHLYGGAPVYSDPLTVWISDKFPSQLTTFSFDPDPDTRAGYFGCMVLSLSWAAPSGVGYLKNYNISFTSTGFGSCSLAPFYRVLPPSATNFTLVVSSSAGTDGLKCGCGMSVQIVAKPLLSALTAPKVTVPATACSDLAKASDIILQCSSVWNTTSSMFKYNFTWTLNYPPSVLDGLNTATLSLQSTTSGGGRPGGGGGGGASMIVTQIPILVNQTVYTYRQDYAPNTKDGRYSFIVTFPAQLSFQQFSTITLTKNCSLVAMPPVSQVNVTTPKPQWIVAGPQAVLLLDMQLYWAPPLANITSYDVWVGAQPISSSQSVPGKVQSFQVQQPPSSVGKRQAESSSTVAYNLFINITFDLASLRTSVPLALYIQLRTVNSLGVSSDWSSPSTLLLAVNLTIPGVTMVTNTMTSSRAQQSSSPPQTVTAAPAVNGGDSLIILIAAVVPSVAVLLLAICIVAAILCVIRSKNKVILGEQTNLGLTEGKTLHDLLNEKISLADDWEIDANDVVVFVDQKLGEGAFGEVYKGTVSGSCLTKNPQLLSEVKKLACVPVAIKVLKATAQGKEKQDFMNEIEMMKRITSGNPHIVNMIGCVTRSEPVCLMCELVTYGSLLSYLRTHQKKGTPKASEASRVTVNTNGSIVGRTDDSSMDDAAPYLEPGSEYSHLDPEEDGLGPLEENDLIAFAYQIADGMQHLASLNIVHRDLACRNILIGENKTLKITDFGLSREVEEVYEVKGKRKLPWRWMALESLERKIFTTYSDVWSFGITLWEISTFGGFPYPSISNDDLLKTLKVGYRMEKPENCSHEVYIIMLECWSGDPCARPSFSHLKSKFELMLQLSASERDQPYIDLTLDTNQYVYIPDGIEEDDDPNKMYLAPVTLSKTSTQPLAVKSPERNSASSTTAPTDLDQRRMDPAGRGVRLARMGSNNSYIDCPRSPPPSAPELSSTHSEQETEL